MPMLFRTKVALSTIHGLGLFAQEPIPKDSTFWEHDPIIDGWVDQTSADSKGYEVFMDHMDYFYCYDHEHKVFIRHADTLIFANHSDNPNLTSPTKYFHVANKDIDIGEELTLNYRDICDYGVIIVERKNLK